LPEENTKNNNNHEPEKATTQNVNIFKVTGRATKSVLKIFLKWIVFPIFLLLTLLLLILTFFPFNSIKNYSLETFGGIDPEIVRIGYLDFSIFSGLNIDDVEIAATEGFKKPLLTINKIQLEYSIWDIFSNEFHIHNILIDSPHVNYLANKKTDNITAFLETLPKSDAPTTVEDIEEPSDTTEKSSFKIVLHSFSISNFTAYANDGNHVIDFNHLNLAINGFFSEISSHFDVNVKIANQNSEGANLHFEQSNPQKVLTDFSVSMDTKLAADNVLNPTIKIQHQLNIASKKIETDWPIDPIKITNTIIANASMADDKATLETLTLSFNEHEIIDLVAKLNGLLEQNNLSATLKKLSLPLDKLAPYAKALDNRIDFGGNFLVKNLNVNADVPKVLNKGLPETSGMISLNQIWLAYKPMNLHIKGINSIINIKTSSNPTTDTNRAINSNGDFSIRQISSDFGDISNLKLKFDAGADSIAVSDAGSSLSLSIDKIQYQDDSIGTAELDLKLNTRARVNLVDSKFIIDKLDIAVKDTLLASFSMETELDLQKQLVNFVKMNFKLKPLDLNKLLALVPSGIKASIPKFEMTGKLTTALSANSTKPFSFNIKDPMKLPVVFTNSIQMNNLNFSYPDQALEIKAGRLEFKTKGKPRNFSTSGNIAISSILKNDLELNIKDIEIPLEIKFTPSRIDNKLELLISQLNSAKEVITISDIKLSIISIVKGSILDQAFSKVESNIDFNCNEIVSAKTETATLTKPKLSLKLKHLAKAKITKVKMSSSFDTLNLKNNNLSLNNFSQNLNGNIEGVELPLTAEADLHPDRISITNTITLANLNKPDTLQHSLESSSLNASLTLEDLQSISLKEFNLKVPGVGLNFLASGNVSNLQTTKNIFVDFKTTFPSFTLDTKAIIDNRKNNNLLENLYVSGLAGIELKITSLPNSISKLEGKLIADNFNFKANSTKTIINDDKTTTTTDTTIEINDFDTNVPLIQLIDLKNKTLVKSDIDIFKSQSRNILYETMRTYMQQQANFQIDTVLWKQKTNNVVKELKANDISLDIIYQDNTFAINRMYVSLLGGGITGALQVHIASMFPDPLDVHVHFENQITGLNLAYLTSKDSKTVTSETEFSSLIKLNFGLADRFVEGNVDITRLSLAQLDEMLIFLDPEEEDPKVQNNRDFINSWYIKMLDPEVSLVSMWINYGNLNMDINMNAWFFLGTILQNTLEKNKIRRYDIVPILNTFLPTKDPTKVAKQKSK